MIASVTQPFCHGCIRRLSAEGKLCTCLFAVPGTTCAVRCAAAPATRRCAGQVAAIWTRRTGRYSEQRTLQTVGKDKVTRRGEMSDIGG